MIGELPRRRLVCGRARKFLHVPTVTANSSYRSRGKSGHDCVLCMCELRGIADLRLRHPSCHRKMNHHIRRFRHGRIQSGYGRVRWKIQHFSDLRVEDGENLAGFFGRTTRYCLTICRHPSRQSIPREEAIPAHH